MCVKERRTSTLRPAAVQVLHRYTLSLPTPPFFLRAFVFECVLFCATQAVWPVNVRMYISDPFLLHRPCARIPFPMREM